MTEIIKDKRLFVLLTLLLLLGGGQLLAQSYTMGTSGTQNVTTCNAWIYDNGGSTGSYSSSCNATMVIHAASGSTIAIDQGTYNTESSYDWVKIYDGAGTSGSMLAELQGQGSVTLPIVAPSGTMTVEFHSDGSVQRDGFALHVTCTVTEPSYYIVPTSGNQNVTTCDAWVYDSGGPTSDYTNSSNGTLVINPETTNDIVVIDQGTYYTENSFDWVKIYDGVGTTGTVLANLQGQGTITSPIASTNGSLTIEFHSDGSVTHDGFALHVSCSPAPTTEVMSAEPLTTCNARWSDPGGAGNYANNTDITQTICSDNGDHLFVSFLSFALSSGDRLYVYDGNSTTSPQIGNYTGTTLPGTILSSGSCLTFRFVSNGSGVNAGWLALISCQSCASSPVSIAPGSPCAPDGANPFCTDENPYGVTYPSGTGSSNAHQTFFGQSSSTGYIGCLYSTPRPAWYYMRINSPGDLLIYIEQISTSGVGLDVDFACWGPFTAASQSEFMDNICCGLYDFTTTETDSHRPTNGNHHNDMGGYPVGNLVDCSYSGSSTEWCFIPNAQTGQFYILLITNYNGGAGTINFTPVASSSTATTDCSLLAQVTNDGPYCEGDTIHLVCQNPESGATYAWSGPAGWTSSEQNPVIVNATPNMSGSYSMTKHLGSQTSEPATTDVVVNPNPVITLTTTRDTVCSNENATITAAGGNMYMWNTGVGGASITVTPTTSQMYTVTVTTSGNCHGVDSLFLVAAQTAETHLRDTVCRGIGYNNYGFELSAESTADGQARTLQATYATVMGCDSVVTLDLAFFPQPVHEFSVSECDSYTWNDQTYTQSGDYVQHFQTIHGCDSMVTLHLTINNSLTTEFSITQCDSYTWNDQTYTQSGDYTQQFTTTHDCDSVVTLHLTIHPSLTSQFDATACSEYVWNDSVYTQTGNYIQHFQTSHGCDSTVTLHLTINPVMNYAYNVDQCDTFVWNDSVYTVSGDYVQHFSTPQGCDSTVTLHLTIHNSIETEWQHTECDSYTWNAQTYTESGDYVQEFQTVHGCDSVVTLHLLLYNSVESEFDTIGCESFSWNNHNYTETGDFVQHLQTEHGCDSAVTMHLTIDRLVVSTRDLLAEHCGHEDGAITLNVVQSEGPVSFNWGNLADGHDNMAENLAVGDYTVSVRDSMCAIDYDFHIYPAPAPNACFNVLPMSESVSYGTMMRFLDCSQNATNWHWDMGNGETFSDRSVDYIYPSVGYFTVTLIVDDEFGCADTATHEVRVREEMRFYVPNSFSPNGDGLNDVFRPEGSEISEEGYTLSIYSRWGELVYMTHNLSDGWDGTVKGRKVEGGSVMRYIIHYQNKDGRPFVKEGVVHVL